MLIDIDKVIVGDRIRRDFGDLDELAEDIKENGLINPPVINKSYILLAGERRLRACKSLGWPQIEVRMMDTRDAEHELNIEISENDVRKGFSKSERLGYIQRLYRIEQAKARERQATFTGGADPQQLRENSHEAGRADDRTAAAFGISSNTMRRELYIDEHKDLLDPDDFAEWDEGKLSTNKAFQKIKAAQREAEAAKKNAERKLQQAEIQLEAADQELADALEAKENAEAEAIMLKRKLESVEHPEPKVVTHEVVREVVPDDYDDMKQQVSRLKHDTEIYVDTNRKLRRQLDDAQQELGKARDVLGMDKTMQDVRRDVQYLTSATINYVRRYGGLTWTVQQLGEIDNESLDNLRNSVKNLATFSVALTEALDVEYGKRHS